MFVRSLAGSSPRKFGPGGSPSWLDDGRLCYTDMPVHRGATKVFCGDGQGATTVYDHGAADIKGLGVHGSGKVAIQAGPGLVHVVRDGTATQVADVSPRKAGAWLLWSDDGSKLAFTSKEGNKYALSIWEEGGAAREIVPLHPKLAGLAFSPDGSAIAMTLGDNCTRNHRTNKDECEHDLYVFDFAAGKLRRLTHHAWPRARSVAWVAR